MMSERENDLRDPFLAAYVEAALFTGVDRHDKPLDDNFGPYDFTPEAWEKIKADCAKFKESPLFPRIFDKGAILHGARRWGPLEMAGHDFWLTRDGQGAGFWDGDWNEELGKALTELAKTFGKQSITEEEPEEGEEVGVLHVE